MRRVLVVVSVVLVLAVGAGVAQAATFKGGIKGEPQTSLKLKVKKINGDRFVTRVIFDNIPVSCNNGDGESSGEGPAGEDGLEVKQREFSGEWKYGTIKGRFKGGGKLTGKITVSVDAGPPQGQCDSGKLPYVVRD
jgi:hypothetical protein